MSAACWCARKKDTKGTGKPDVIEYYENNRLIRIGFDTNGDGQPDRYQ